MTCLRSHSKEVVDQSRQFGRFSHSLVYSPLLCRQDEGKQIYFAPPKTSGTYSGTCHSQLPTKGRERQRHWGASSQKDTLGQPALQEPPGATSSLLPGSRIRKNQYAGHAGHVTGTERGAITVAGSSSLTCRPGPSQTMNVERAFLLES